VCVCVCVLQHDHVCVCVCGAGEKGIYSVNLQWRASGTAVGFNTAELRW